MEYYTKISVGSFGLFWDDFQISIFLSLILFNFFTLQNPLEPHQSAASFMSADFALLKKRGDKNNGAETQQSRNASGTELPSTVEVVHGDANVIMHQRQFHFM